LLQKKGQFVIGKREMQKRGAFNADGLEGNKETSYKLKVGVKGGP